MFWRRQKKTVSERVSGHGRFTAGRLERLCIPSHGSTTSTPASTPAFDHSRQCANWKTEICMKNHRSVPSCHSNRKPHPHSLRVSHRTAHPGSPLLLSSQQKVQPTPALRPQECLNGSHLVSPFAVGKIHQRLALNPPSVVTNASVQLPSSGSPGGSAPPSGVPCCATPRPMPCSPPVAGWREVCSGAWPQPGRPAGLCHRPLRPGVPGLCLPQLGGAPASGAGVPGSGAAIPVHHLCSTRNGGVLCSLCRACFPPHVLCVRYWPGETSGFVHFFCLLTFLHIFALF